MFRRIIMGDNAQNPDYVHPQVHVYIILVEVRSRGIGAIISLTIQHFRLVAIFPRNFFKIRKILG